MAGVEGFEPPRELVSGSNIRPPFPHPAANPGRPITAWQYPYKEKGSAHNAKPDSGQKNLKSSGKDGGILPQAFERSMDSEDISLHCFS